MVKIHTRVKRIKGTPTRTRKHRFWFTNVVAKKGFKSFDDKAKAIAWAKETSVDQKTFELYELPSGKKWQWRPLARD